MIVTSIFSWGIAFENHRSKEKYMKERDNKYLFFVSFGIPILIALNCIFSNWDLCRPHRNCDNDYPTEWDSILTFFPWLFQWLT